MPKTNLTNELYEYALQIGAKEHPILKEIHQFNLSLPTGRMQIPPEQSQFMGLMAQIANAKKYLELGVYTGYSSLSMALHMGKNSRLYAIDNNQEHLNIATKFWTQANVIDQFIVLCGDGTNVLHSLLTNEHVETFDIAFIDANKSDYIQYFEYCYKLVKPGGIIFIDNVFMGGKVLLDNPPNFARAVIEFNQFLSNDNRVKISVLPMADGLTIAYKERIA